MALFNGLEIDKGNWTEVFSACMGQVIATQSACADLIVKNSKWNLDFPSGTLTIGKTDYPIQFLGSESTVSNTWLWGWQNVNNFNDEIITFANEIKQKGDDWQLEPLRTPEFDLNDILNGHTLSMVSCGISEKNICYYRCVHDKGAVFVTFSGVSDNVFEPVGIEKFSSIAAQCIQQCRLDHRIFIKSFLKWNKTMYEETDNMIIGYFPQELFIEFEKTENGERISFIKT